MKITKLISFLLVIAISSFAQAKPEKKVEAVTKEAYLASVKAAVEKKGNTFDEKKTAARFDRIDADKDGVITPEERKAFAAKNKKSKEK